MRAIVITEPGGPGVLSWAEVPDPVPGPGEVVIDVAAAGVNRADLMQRQGFYPPPPGAPPYPGLECSGRISALGDGVTGWQTGRRGVRPAGRRRLRGARWPCRRASCCRSRTASRWPTRPACPRRRAPSRAPSTSRPVSTPGEVYLVHGGAGGMGSFAIQLGKADGAVVACTAGTPDKLARCRELGADLAISYRDQDFVEPSWTSPTAAAPTSSWTSSAARTWPGTWPRWPPGAGWW